MGALLANAATFSLGTATAIALVSIAIATALGASAAATWTIVLFVGYIGAVATASACEARLRAERRVGWVATTTVIEKGVLLGGVALAVVLTDATASSIAAIYLLSGLARLATAAAVALRDVRLVRPTAGSIAQVVRSSAPFAASAAALNVVPRLDAFFLLLLSSTSAAYVALGDRVLGPALFLPVILSVTLYPFVAAHLHAHVNWKLVGTAGALGALVALVGILLSPTLVPLVFGEKYRDAIVPVQVLLASLPFIYATNILLTYLYSAGRERRVLGVTLVAAIAGTIAVVCGQIVGGADLAAFGVLLRQALFTGALAAVGLSTIGRVQPTSDWAETDVGV